MNALKTMKKTRMERVRAELGANTNAINHILRQQNGLLNEILILQKNILATMNALKRRGLITDLDVQAELSILKEMEEMQKKALIIDPNKGGK